MHKHIAPLAAGAFAIVSGTALLNSSIALKADAHGIASGMVGVMTAAYFGGYLIGAAKAPDMVLRIGHIRFFAACAAMLTTTILAHGLTTNPMVWVALRFVSGVSALGMYLTFESWLNVALPDERRGMLFSLYFTMTLTAMSVGQLPLMAGEGKGEVSLSIAALLVVLSIVPFAITRIDEPMRHEEVKADWSAIWTNAPLGMVGAFAGGAVTGSLWGLGPLYFLKVGLTTTQVSLAMIAVIMGGASLQWILGKGSDLTDRRRFIAGVGYGGALLAVSLAFNAKASFTVQIVLGFFYGAAALSLYGLSVAHINDYVDRRDRLGSAKIAIALFGWGAFLAPLAIGLVMEMGGAAGLPLSFAVTLGLVGLYATYRMVRRSPVAPEDRSTFYPMARTSPVAMEIDPRLIDKEEGSEG